MLRLISLVLVITGFAFQAHAAAERFNFDPSHTNVLWFVNHLGFSSPSGKFTSVGGFVELDDQKPELSRVEVVIKTDSILTGIPDFDTHLKSKDFFNAEQFPEAKFVSKNVTVTGKNTAKVEGDFTLLGVTKPLILDVTLNSIAPNPRSQKKTAGFSVLAVIKRSLWGMNYGVPVVGDDVRLMAEVEAVAETVALGGKE